MTVEFKVGDLVHCAFFGDEVFELIENYGSSYPISFIRKGGSYVFMRDGRYYSDHTSPSLTLVSRPKKKESVTWYRVCFHLKGNKKPYFTNNVFESVESFLSYEDKRKQDFHFIHLERVVTHDYDVESGS